MSRGDCGVRRQISPRTSSRRATTRAMVSCTRSSATCGSRIRAPTFWTTGTSSTMPSSCSPPGSPVPNSPPTGLALPRRVHPTPGGANQAL